MRAMWPGFFKRLSAYFKLQIVTKTLSAAVLFPLFWMAARALMRNAGQEVVTNQTLFRFLVSWQGLLFILLLFVLVLLVLMWEMIALIEISDESHEQPVPARLKSTLAYIPRFFTRAGMALIIYLAVLVPLGGLGLTLGLFKNVGIPSFILEFILGNRLLALLYAALMAAMAIVGLRWIFTFHAMAIEQLPLSAAIARSRHVFHAHRWHFLLHFMGANLLVALAAGGLMWGWNLLVSACAGLLPDSMLIHGVVLALFMVQNSFLVLLAFFAPAFETHLLTWLFNTYRGKVAQPAYVPRQALGPKAVFLIVLLLISGSLGVFFQSVFEARGNVQVIAHRAGGNLAAENSLEGLRQAKAAGAALAEIDIQRTRDGHYVLNHDSSYKRLAGSARASQEMSLHEIGELRLQDHFDASRPSQPVAALEEALDLCGSDFGLLIELKGSTADTKMADDVAAMIRRRGLTQSARIITLDYDLIEYCASTCPDITTGYLYYLAFGDVARLKADILIIEESAATLGMVSAIHKAGKLVYVWTVNRPEQMEAFLKRDIDGIITDDPLVLLEKKNSLSQHSQRELMLQLFRQRH